MSQSNESEEVHAITESKNVNTTDVEDDSSNEKIDSNGTNGTDGDGMVEIPVDKSPSMENISSEAEHGGGGMVLARNMDLSERMQTFKNWGMNTFMRTKQKVKEKLSRTSRTVDLSLEDSIEVLKTQKTQYAMMVANNQRVMEQLRQLILVHQCASRMNSDLAQTERALAESFLGQCQIETATVGVVKELIGKLTCSNETLETLVSKTFDDLMTTIQTYENARVEFDAYKTETVRLVTQIQQKKDATATDEIRLHDMQDNLEQRRLKYENNKNNVQIKINLLEDHKNRVIQREILNCRHAWFNYYSQCSDLFSSSKSPPIRSQSKPEDQEEDAKLN